MKPWRKTSGVQIGRVVSSCSLIVVTLVCRAGPYSDAEARLHAVTSPSSKRQVLDQLAETDRELRTYVERSSPSALQQAQDYVSLRALAERASPTKSGSSAAKGIKSSGLYRDESMREEANWLHGAIERMKNLVPKWNPPEARAPAALPIGGFAQLFIYLVWFVLAGGVIAFIVYAFSFVRLSKKRRRRAKALLEESEPERSLDEWLAMAEAFEREGRFREAVRALYLACLLKFDEANIARFRREQTNWEHLARIDASPKKPPSIDFRAATRAFDQVWYGHRIRGSQEVEAFRGWYQGIRDALEAQR